MSVRTRTVEYGRERYRKNAAKIQARRREIRREAPPLSPAVLSEKDKKRFLSRLRRTDRGCLVYTGRKHNGQGVFWLNGRNERAHRIAWILDGNSITAERPWILHDCPGGDDRACCQPLHLWAGTVVENAADMAHKKRGVKGKAGLPRGVKRSGNKFEASVKRGGGARHYLGTFQTAAEASAAAESVVYGLSDPPPRGVVHAR